MSGHNKWSKIKHKKAASDAAKSKIFSRLVKLIQVEAKRCGGDMSDPGLITVIEKAKKENMPKDNIERAIKKATGADAVDLELMTYEAYGPGGVALMIDVLSDNRNRAAAEVKHILSKQGLELANPGSASWAFTREGTEWVPTTTVEISETEGEKLERIIEALEENDDVQEVFTNAE